MKIYNYSEARQNFTTVLNTALKEEVIITRKDGSKFKIISINDKKGKGKSPLEGIKGIKADITTKELVDIIREGREGSEYIKDKY
ncbi:type II toxin-antitoxin system Phd/YefM family antitoxin [Treponema primitia]|uniref:type II toxin-antitoxin system Phd/YefM family antitoxin n=1 Tax=Treponema primitia TaxID=88058 RepID=UPI0002554D1E|nr:type II toxin-antitoxin system Phd/YefM family antitoxin [Treponema primitia]